MRLSTVVDERFHATLGKLYREALPIKTAFKLKGIMKMAQEETIKYDELRKDALQKYGIKKEDGTLQTDDAGNVQFEPESMQAFAKELNELLSLEISLPTISVAELGDKMCFTVEELTLLDGLIVE